jgi:acetyltransferase-like isoleucine patch superfamily enzyme
MIYENKEKNVYIEANNIEIGNNVKFGKDISIKVYDTFKVGDNSIIGDRFSANGENIEIGEYFYNGPTDSRGMVIGGGSAKFPFSKLKIGSGMVCHTGHINLAQPVNIGNDVGLSHDVDLITHGFWTSVLEGYPRLFKGINIGNNVIVGWKTIIMSGVNICDNVVIGSHATVTKSLTTEKGIYVGSPAKLVSTITEPVEETKTKMLADIVEDFCELISYYEVARLDISGEYPTLLVNDLVIDVKRMTYTGTHDEVTDAFRDFARRYGIRLYSPRGFNFDLKRK